MNLTKYKDLSHSCRRTIEVLMKHHNGNSYQIAKELGISPSIITFLLNGSRNTPTLMLCMALHDKYGISTDWLLYGEKHGNTKNDLINGTNKANGCDDDVFASEKTYIEVINQLSELLKEKRG